MSNISQGADVLILTEAGEGVGFGHLTRCQALRDGLLACGISVEIKVADKNQPQTQWFAKAYQQDLLTLCASFTHIVVDSYLASQDVIDVIATHAKTPIFFDDNQRCYYAKGYVINGAIGASGQQGSGSSDVTILAGVAYFPLRKEFWPALSEQELAVSKQGVLLTFGGADGKGMTRRILSEMRMAYPDLIIHVILGPAFNDSSLKNAFQSPKVIFHEHCSAAQMRALMVQSQVAISAGGQTVYEMARLGLAPVIIITSDNQIAQVRSWEKAGFIDPAPNYNDGDLVEQVMMNLTRLFDPAVQSMRGDKGKATVDGQGVKRIINAIWGR